MNLTLFDDTNQLYQATKELFAALGFTLKGETAPYRLAFVLDNLPTDIPELHKKLLANENCKVYFVGVVNEDTLNDKVAHLFDAEAARNGKYNEEGEHGRNGLGVVAIDLDFEPKKADLVALVRMFNRNFETSPIILVIRYLKKNQQNQQTYHFSIASSFRRDRIKKSQYEGEVVEKVYVLKDVNVQNPHRGHIDTLADLKPRKNINSFEELYLQWLEVFSTNLLNKRFYRELANWYFWALQNVKFPYQYLQKQSENQGKTDEELQRMANEIALIRFTTRLIFVWFLKEQSLINANLFDVSELKTLLKNFEAEGKQSSFYKAILQNLFFATLNMPIESKDDKGNRVTRGFATDTKKYGDKNYGIKNLYRYHDEFAKTEQEVIQQFATIPFLNGGLFDCLDIETETDKKNNVVVDGFSRNPKNQPIVPDFLIFGKEATFDLNKVYETNNRGYTVRGIVRILNSYKFTVIENTPLEEEVALDPELLGNVFENLLAYYNPETGNTARKGTGSFYTPREIVYYMIDESLVAYLKNKLVEYANEGRGFVGVIPPTQANIFGQTKPVQTVLVDRKKITESQIADIETKLRKLIAYGNDANEFTKEETKLLIETLFSCKILDPACGSGAFPMGVLQKMLKILQKLDKNNEITKQIVFEKGNEKQRKALVELAQRYEIQLTKNQQDIETIEKILSENVKQTAKNALEIEKNKIKLHYEEERKEIEKNFNPSENELDYARKLYLIQYCIFGLDIQPVAIHITKLRFFLSLIIEQKQNDKPEENYSIMPLPNLDTKIVAANTLIAPQGLETHLFVDKINELKTQLKANRLQYLHVRERKEKQALQQKDAELQQEIKKLLWQEKDTKELFKNAEEVQKYIANLPQEIKKLQAKLLKLKATSATVSADHKKNIKSKKDNLQGKITALEAEQLKWTNLLPTFQDIEKAALFNPYNQNQTAPFFDADWMFGVNKKFDIVIGNPPYLQIKWVKNKIDLEKQDYTVFSKSSDLYCLFYEKATTLLKYNGIGCFITSNKWLRADYGKYLRNYLLQNCNPLKIIDLNSNKIFDNATVDTNILIWHKAEYLKKLQAVNAMNYLNLESLISNLNKNFVYVDYDLDSNWNIISRKQLAIKEKVEKQFTRLKEFPVTLKYGILTGASNVFIINQLAYNQLVKADESNKTILKPLLRGQDLTKYGYNFKGLYLINSHNGVKSEKLPPIDVPNDFPTILDYFEKFGKSFKERGEKGNNWYNLRNCAYINDFDKPKIIYADIVQNEGKFYYDDKGFYTNDTAFIIVGEHLKYLTSILNSKFVNYMYKNFYSGGGLGETGIRYKKEFLEQIPIPQISATEQQPFIDLVDYILWLKANASPQVFIVIEHNTSLAHKFEALLDMMVFELYFAEEMKAANTDILRFVTIDNFPPLSDEQTNEEKATQIGKVWTWLSEYENEIRNRMILANMHNKTLQLINGN
jgi:adenine-specific DNA-methyltransferase